MTRSSARWFGLPIAAQILGLLVGGLVVAQVVTLLLTLLLPPKPPPQHSLADIAQALRGQASASSEPLLRSVDDAPPSLQSPGWLVSQRSTDELAQMLGVPTSDVRLLFYAPPPPSGMPPGQPRAEATGKPRLVLASFLFFDQGPGGGPGPGGPGGPGVPGGFPGGGFPGQMPGAGPSSFPTPASSGPSSTSRPTRPPARPPSTSGMPASRSAPVQGAPTGTAPAGRPGALPQPGGFQPGPGEPGAGAPARSGPFGGVIPRTPLDAAIFRSEATIVPDRPVPPAPVAARVAPALRSEPAPEPADPLRAVTAPTTAAAPVIERPALAAAPAAPVDGADATPARPLPAPLSRGLFGLAASPYVEGEFVAALRVAPNQWVTVKPRPEAFPNSWQRRILLWFALSFAIVAPLGWLFARRLAAPLGDFANAAEVLGRDPQAEVTVSEGPAEVGRAARAFNVMQRRLKRYVEDRTGMIGAISHDLRTPLARMRFRLERASPELKAALNRDISQMEEMITSVLTFMRDDAAGAPRQRVDLRSVLEVVVDDAAAGGGDIQLDPGPPAEVEIDLLSVQRVFENLVDNALKYGARATVSLFMEGDEAVAEVADEGPGLADAELEQVFKPFHRSAEATASGKGGVGLGLATSRSAVRAHGGELTLRRAERGLVAQVRLPALGRLASAA